MLEWGFSCGCGDFGAIKLGLQHVQGEAGSILPQVIARALHGDPEPEHFVDPGPGGVVRGTHAVNEASPLLLRQIVAQLLALPQIL